MVFAKDDEVVGREIEPTGGSTSGFSECWDREARGSLRKGCGKRSSRFRHSVRIPTEGQHGRILRSWVNTDTCPRYHIHTRPFLGTVVFFVRTVRGVVRDHDAGTVPVPRGS